MWCGLAVAWRVGADLSFNNITRIEGLDTLTRLTDLSLYNNQISDIHGLEALTGLQCLSLGNNLVVSYEETVKYLRRFKKLRLLNLQGNPLFESKRDKKRLGDRNGAGGPDAEKRERERLQLSEAELGEYRNYVIAYMKQLRYLDYKLITEEEVRAPSTDSLVARSYQSAVLTHICVSLSVFAWM